MGLKELPLSKRPREKAFLLGLEYLSDEEVIAIILSSGYKNVDVVELAHQLLKKYLSLNNLTSLSVQELAKNPGIKKIKAIKLLASFELCRRIEKERLKEQIKIKDINQVIEIIKPYIFNLKQEKLFLMMMNRHNIFLGLTEMSLGSDSSVIISPKEIISTSLKFNSSKIIIIHNHPSNNYQPSSEDVMQTNNLIIACNILGIVVMEHFIATNNNLYGIISKKKITF